MPTRHGDPAVTVLMAVYNGLPYLPEAIESVLGQSLRDFEFVIVDDGSTDGSVECIRSYGDPRIRLQCNERNLGQTRSLNRGLAAARGRFVARLDADDVCLGARLEKQTRFLQERPDVSLVGTWRYDLDGQGRKPVLVRKSWSDCGTYTGWLLTAVCPIWHPTVMFRREVVAEVGGYDESFRIAQDYDLWLRLLWRRRYASVLEEPLVRCRIHERQLTVAQAALHQEEVKIAQERMIAVCSDSREERRLSPLLRGDDALWEECRSKEDVVGALRALTGMMQRIRSHLQWSDREFTGFARVIHRRVGLGVRLGGSLGRWPAPVFYSVLFGLSPLLIPGLRRRLRRLRGLRRAMVPRSL